MIFKMLYHCNIKYSNNCRVADVLQAKGLDPMGVGGGLGYHTHTQECNLICTWTTQSGEFLTFSLKTFARLLW